MNKRLLSLTAALAAAAFVFAGCSGLRAPSGDGKMVMFSALGELRPDTAGGPLFGAGKSDPLCDLKPFLASRTLVMADLVGGIDFGCSPTPNAIVWNTDWLSTLAANNIRILSLADEHALDCGPEALAESLNWLLLRDLYPVGAGADQRNARSPAYLSREGVTLGVAAFLVAPLAGASCETCPGPATYQREAMIAAFKEMKSRADFRIAVLHFAERRSSALTEEELAVVREVVDYGADLVIGYGPAAAGGILRVRGRWVIASLGRALGDPQNAEGDCDGLLLSAEFTPDKMMNLRLIPVEIRDGKPVLLRGDEATKVLAKIRAASPDATANGALIGDILYLK